MTHMHSAISRRSLLWVVSAGFVSKNPAPPAHALLDPTILSTQWEPDGPADAWQSYVKQLRAGEQSLVTLLSNWKEVTTTRNNELDGDAVRRVVGTVGVGSPLFRLSKTLRTVGEDLDRRELVDIVQYMELSDVLVDGVKEVDMMAYSSTFSDASGNVGRSEQSSASYLERSRKATETLLFNYRQLLKLLPKS